MGRHYDKIAVSRRPASTSTLLSHGRAASSTRRLSSVIRLLIVADYPVVRHGLRQIFGGAEDIRIVAEARGAMDSIRQIETCHPDAVLIDFAGKTSYRLFCRLQTHHSHLPILVFSTAHDRYAKKAVQRGAMGYLTKDHVPDHLVLAIRRISQGEKYAWPPLVPSLHTQVGLIATAWLALIGKIWNPLFWSSPERPSLPR